MDEEEEDDEDDDDDEEVDDELLVGVVVVLRNSRVSEIPPECFKSEARRWLQTHVVVVVVVVGTGFTAHTLLMTTRGDLQVRASLAVQVSE